jgi:hypothetical protein
MSHRQSMLLQLALLSAPLQLLAQAPAQPPANSPASSPANTPASSQAAAQAEAGEPRATTSPDASPAPDSGKSNPSAGTPTGAGGDSPAARAAPRSSKPSAPSAPAHAANGGKGAADRLELGTATVTGDREQPKVMYIVPWKKSDIGDLSGKPMNSLLDEALAPIDREEFKRQVMYYQAVKSDAAQNGASKAPAQGEK